MKIQTIKTSALAVLAAGVLTAPSAMASGFTYTTTDILIGFRQAGNNTSDYVIDLTKINSNWSTSNLRSASAPLTLTLTGLGTDFTSAFGSSSPSNVLWGAVGTNGNTTANGDPFKTIYISEPTGNAAPPLGSLNSSSIIGMGAVGNNYGPLSTGAVNSGTILTESSLASDPSSYSSNVLNTFGNNALAPIETALGSTLDLWRLPQTGGGVATDIGTLSIGANSVTFTPTATVPEPATALFGCVGLGVIALIRRRRAHVA